ncbi:MAG: helix-turn-helix domain-containing protein [Candidatus Latescibacteria bacterium]|nr:helix-turn-helix domain-containing protein [Candidatus Latescibacterota bacterium]
MGNRLTPANLDRRLPLDEFLTIDDVCAWLKLKRHYLYKLTSQQRIPHVKIGRHVRFRRTDLEAWLADQRTEAVSVDALSTVLHEVLRS